MANERIVSQMVTLTTRVPKQDKGPRPAGLLLAMLSLYVRHNCCDMGLTALAAVALKGNDY